MLASDLSTQIWRRILERNKKNFLVGKKIFVIEAFNYFFFKFKIYIKTEIYFSLYDLKAIFFLRKKILSLTLRLQILRKSYIPEV